MGETKDIFMEAVARVEDLEEELEKYKLSAREWEQACRRVEVEKEEKILALEKEAKELEEENKGLKDELSRVSGLLRRVEITVGEKDKRIELLEEAKLSLNVERNKRIEELRGELNDRYSSNERIKKLEYTIGLRRNTIEDQDKKIKKLKEELSANDKHRQEMASELQTKQRRIEQLENKALRDTARSLPSLRMDRENEVDKLRRELTAAKEFRDLTRNMINELHEFVGGR